MTNQTNLTTSNELLQMFAQTGVNEQVIQEFIMFQQFKAQMTAMENVTRVNKKDYTNEELAEWFLQELRLERVEKTVLAYKQDIYAFIEYMENESLLSVDKSDVLYYLDFLKTIANEGKPYSLATINRKHSALSVFYKFLSRKKLVETDAKGANVFQQVEQISSDHLTISHDFLTIEECRKFFEAIKTTTYRRSDYVIKRNMAMYQIMIAAGLRYEELQNLTINDFDLENCQISVLGKRSKRRTVPFPKTYHETFLEFWALREQMDVDIDNLFISEIKINKNGEVTGGLPIPHNLSTKTIGKYIEIAGIELNGRRITNHSLRHTYASHQIERGCPVARLSKLMGHKQPSFTMEHYVHVAYTQEDEAIANELNYFSF